ncbi:hypothetical protein [Photobacterium sp. OFAV2-7]|uniref:hypothetical protein n=1 Tax=Photobacterium sp. OFAV2-7 TaxID=2917748 RepID=UPI001EF47198|nr:hypothetical protein [Photobacterium sp. OFAV2-7]MCG7587250.1 hypothetical protein [Photobacterium sp. OFAV2-7]
MTDLFDIIRDFILIAVIVIALATIEWLLHFLGLPNEIISIIELIDRSTKIALIALLSMALVLRFYRRVVSEHDK